MQVCAVSPRSTVAVEEILSFLQKQTAALVILPGAAPNSPSAKQVQSVIRGDVHVFVEEGSGKNRGRPTLVNKRSIRFMPRQVFAQQPDAKHMDVLASALSRRMFVVGRRRVTFVICGEINGFSIDGSAKKRRHFGTIDIVVNPAHYPMGRWHILDRKFTALSKRGAAIHTANNTLKTSNSKTDVRIYRRGKQVGRRRMQGNIAWCVATI